jgi:hypothetical protein
MNRSAFDLGNTGAAFVGSDLPSRGFGHRGDVSPWSC